MIYSIIGNMIGASYDKRKYILDSFDIGADLILILGTIEHLIYKKELNISIKKWKNKYPNIEHGENFNNYLKTNLSYDSYGKYGMIRVIPYIYYYKDEKSALKYGIENSKSSHNNEESIKASEVIIKTAFMIKNKKTKEEIYKEILNYYDLKFHIKDKIREYKYDPICQNIVPYCIVAFLESKNYEDALMKIISLGGDLETNCMIVSMFSSLYYGNIDIKFKNYYMKNINEDIFNLLSKFINICE